MCQSCVQKETGTESLEQTVVVTRHPIGFSNDLPMPIENNYFPLIRQILMLRKFGFALKYL